MSWLRGVSNAQLRLALRFALGAWRRSERERTQLKYRVRELERELAR